MIRQQAAPKQPVRASGLPLIGNMPELAGDPLKFVSDLQRKHGDVVAFSLMGKNMVLISNPADIERVLTIGVHGPQRLIIVFVDQLGGTN